MANQIDETKALSETRIMSGRRVIKSSVSAITENNVQDVLLRALETHALNRSEIDYLWKYYNGYELPPCKRGVKVIVTTIVNSGRDANGVVVGQRVGRDQYKIDGLEWAWLTAEQWESILKAVSNFFFHVTFIDPVTNSKKTIKMYCGDRTGEPYWLDKNGKPTHYRDCKVNLIDTGE